MLLPPSGSEQPESYMFSVALPSGWSINHPRIGGDSWRGTIEGDDITLSIQGGPMAISAIYEVVEGGPIETDPQKAARHTVTEEVIGGMRAILVRPNAGEDGITGLMLQLPTGKVKITGRNLSEDEQALVFEIFRSIRR